jgi:hypothetical protein
MRKIFVAAVSFGFALAAGTTGASASAATLYGIDNGANSLVTIDSVTGTKNTVGSLGTNVDFSDLAWDGTTLFMLGGRGNNGLYSVNTTTGAATFIGSHGISDLFGLAYNPLNGTLYASQFSGGSGVYTLNASTGAATLLSDAGPGIGGMTFNSSLGQLIGTQDGTGDFYAIDPVTGAKTQVSAGSGFIDDSDLVFDSGSNSYFLADYRGALFQYDANTFQRTQIASGLGAIDGIELLGAVGNPGGVPEPATWTMLIIGFGAAGAAMRRRPHHSAVAFA